MGIMVGSPSVPNGTPRNRELVYGNQAVDTRLGRGPPSMPKHSSCRVLPVARARTPLAQPRASRAGSPPADLLVAALGGRPRPRVVLEAFASAAEADLGLLAGGVLLTRVSTRSAVSRSIN